jgi:hypothetical protein
VEEASMEGNGKGEMQRVRPMEKIGEGENKVGL